MKFIEIFSKNAEKFMNKPQLADDSVPRGLSYGQIDKLSGKVYAYLQEKNIAKEDFVLICLPRSIKPIIAILGVWKNGSAFVLVEDNYAPERIEFIKNDCGCKLVIDIEAWEEIQRCEPKSGYEETSPHDAAFAIYTSGTTGNPKGVIHEYGNIDRMLLSVDMKTCDKLATDKDRFALVAPLNFIASLLIIVKALDLGTFLYVVSYKTLKNPLLIGMFIITHGITGTFLTPSHIRRMSTKIPGLRFCIIGSEPANEVYIDGLLIHNFYLMTESGFAVCHFLIDKLYSQTPVGDSEFGHKIYLLDEEGKEVKDGEEGEICFENDFVRGYINLPEQTSEVFKDLNDGKGRLYHSGDLAKKDDKGRIVICGRLSDMAKVNGNRVEPAEIEEVAKKVLKIDWAAARIFDDDNKVFIALYYKDNIKLDPEDVRKKMEKILPYYMIPAFFIHIDEIPLRPNGKMDRKALPKPNFSDYKEKYVAPRDEIEKSLCDAFAKVLKHDRVGIKDDFYQIGGDSLASMDVIVASGLNGLQATQIFRGHTAEKIAEIYKAETADLAGENVLELNKKAMEKPQHLTTEQLYMFDYQLYTPKSTMYNLFQMIKFDKQIIDFEKLVDSVNKTIMNHPALLTIFFFNEEGDPMQKYSPKLWDKVKIEKISEKEFDVLKDTLVQPFKMANSLLFRCRFFETEEAGYLFMDVHHTLFDGTSSKVFFGNLVNTYFDQEMEPDYYYYYLRKRHKQMLTKLYKESKEYFDNRYFKSGIKWDKFPNVDHESRSNEDDEMYYDLPIDNQKYESLLNNYNLTPNSFFITANILSTALYNRKKDIMLSWIYNGREDLKDMAIVGLLFRNLPIASSLSANLTIKELYNDIVEQVNKGIEHSSYSPVEINSVAVVDDIECILYQDDLREIEATPGVLGNVDIQHNNAASQNVLDVEILKTDEGLQAMYDYASSRYDESSIAKYRDINGAVIKSLIKHSEEENITVKEILKEVYTELGMGCFISKLFAFMWLG